MLPIPPRLFASLQAQTLLLLEGIPALIDRVFPLPARFRSSLPKDVAELSRLLTSGRGERGLSYMGHKPLLSAYLRYFLPWNLYRLCRLLPDLCITLSPGDRVTDLGCGPLTFAAALWICREDLRSVPLEFNCVDQNRSALDAGKNFFYALAGENPPWKINTIKGDLKTAKIQGAALVCAVNVFNEMYGDISRSNENSLSLNAKKTSRLLIGCGAASSVFLVVEPGFPRCGEFISLLRGALLEQGIQPLSPCAHDKTCPMLYTRPRQGKKRWCHFAFETDDAPQALHRLSQSAGLPKERAVLSFLFASHTGCAASHAGCAAPAAPLRIISDAFPLPHSRFGRYCCSAQGLVLLAGEKNVIEKHTCGSLVNAVIKDERDPKSGALIAQLPRKETP
jgi:ribosomal protein RSM22 (predicted rRNA methylase)